jgi:AcrR family transcriptional regulator
MYNSENREKILTCAENLFRKYGTRSISMDDIAHHLNMSKKTIYESFADKDEIVYQIITASSKKTGGIN